MENDANLDRCENILEAKGIARETMEEAIVHMVVHNPLRAIHCISLEDCHGGGIHSHLHKARVPVNEVAD